MQTAEEILNRDYVSTKENAIQAMIEFAKLHVEAALEAASKKATIKDEVAHFQEGSYMVSVVNKDSIVNAYPLTNIK